MRQVFYYKMRQFIIKYDNYYEMGQFYYKMQRLLQMATANRKRFLYARGNI